MRQASCLALPDDKGRLSDAGASIVGYLTDMAASIIVVVVG